MISKPKQYAKLILESELKPAFSPIQKHGAIGKHIFGNLFGVDHGTLRDRALLERLVREAIAVAKMHLIDLLTYDYGGKKGGMSVIALLEESHLVLHTWNMYDYATVDIYTCGEGSDPEAAYRHIVLGLKPKKQQVFHADRSY